MSRARDFADFNLDGKAVTINESSADLDFRVESNGNANMLVVDAGNDRVGIGTNSPDTMLHLSAASSTRLRLQDTTNDVKTDILVGDTSSVIGNQSNHNLEFMTNDVNRMAIVSSGDVGIGRSNPEAIVGSHGGGLVVQSVSGRASSTTQIAFQDSSGNNQFELQHGGLLIHRTGSSERMRLTSDGHFLHGKTAKSFSQAGTHLYPNGEVNVVKSTGIPFYVNRLSDDGTLVSLHQAGTQEGTISVSGSTVSYNGGHLSRWSQAADGNRIDGLVKGTVMTNLDQMAVWSHDEVLWTADDDLPEGVSVGDVRTAAYTEDNEQLNCMAVSSVEGDANVAGVFVNWDEDDDFNDMNVAMTGDMVIRIASGTTVARGDLLMSAGDGTAKPQGDDIVRSKTIAKVTSTTKSHTYDDGSYLVPCVLMAC